MTNARHQVLELLRAASVTRNTILEFEDFGPLTTSSVFWIGKLLGTIDGAMAQIGKDLADGDPPRIE
jgi:hypothetical protein